MNGHSLTPIFDDLPEWVKDKFTEASLQHKDWKSCTCCGAHNGKKKLLACAQCKPYLINPTYYCGRECQRADWPKHKEQCIHLTRKAAPVLLQKLINDRFPLTKRVEHWQHIHSENIQRLITQLFYFRTGLQPHSTTVIIHLHIDDANSNPPRVWPIKIELTSKEVQSIAPWSSEKRDMVEYHLVFYGPPLKTACALPENWQDKMEAERNPVYDLMFLNLFLAAPQTRKAAEMQWHFLQDAIRFGRATPELPFPAFETQRLMDMDSSSRVLELIQSDEWLKIFKESRDYIWGNLDRIGALKARMVMFEESFLG